jgi:hypothetical protein
MTSGKSAPLKRLARPAALLVGLGLAAYCLRSAGIERTTEVVRGAGPWLPLIVLLQAAIVSLDALALRLLVGNAPSQASHRTWLRASAIANACSVFLPAGRAAGEALRAAALSPSIGAARAASAGVRLQACSLFGTATVSAVAAVITWRATPSTTLPGLLALNALVCGALGAAILVLLRSTRLSTWLRRLLERLVQNPPTSTPSTEAMPRSYALCVLGRLVQALQYGVGVFAVGGRFTMTSAFTSQGIQLLGSSVGDLLPGQLGAMEGVYSAFADSLGLSEAPARALSIVIILRGALIGLALAGLFVAALLPPNHAASATSSANRS